MQHVSLLLSSTALAWPAMVLTTAAYAQDAIDQAGGSGMPWSTIAIGLFATALGVCMLKTRQHANQLQVAVTNAEEYRVSSEEALNAMLLDRADGAAIWSGDTLQIAAGCAKVLNEAEDPSQPLSIAKTLVRSDNVTACMDVMTQLLEDGIPFEQRFTTPDDRQRLISGSTLGARAVVTIIDAKGPKENLPRLTDRLVAAEDKVVTLTDAFDSAPIYAWKRDANGRLEWVNDLYVKGVEAPSLSTVLNCQIELLSGEDGAKVTRRLAQQALQSGEDQSGRETTILDGTRRTLEIHESPYRNGTFGFAIDISAQASASEALMRQIKANEETLDRLHRGVAVFNSDLRLTFSNETLNTIWMLEPTWLESHPSLREVLNSLREKNRVPHTRNFQTWRDDFLQSCIEITEPVERQWHLPDGTAVHVLIQSHPMGGVMILFEDVTDYYAMRRDAATVSAVYHATFSRLSEGVVVFGLDGRCRLANTAFCEGWGLDADTLEGAHISEISKKCAHLYQNKAIWTRAIAQISATSGSREVWTETMERTDGIVMGMASAPLPDGATMFAFQDITDSFNKERFLIEKAEKLGEVATLKGQFLESIHGASHELKIPLNTIVGFSDIMAQEMCGKLNERQHEYIDGISEASNELRQLIGGIIDLAMLEADYFEFCIETIDVKAMLASIIEFISRNSAKGPNIRLNCPDAIKTIPGDAPRFREIMHTLISAINNEAGHDSTLEVGVSLMDGKIAVWVGSQDSDIPLSIRDIFGRNDLSNSIPELRRVELGITLVRQFVQRQGGTIHIRSNVGATQEAIVCHFLTDADAVRRAINNQSGYITAPPETFSLETESRAATPSQ